MKIEVLVTTMHQKDASKYAEMNLQTDAVIANQTSNCGFLEQTINGKNVRLVSTDTCGLSVNRNIGLNYLRGDIIVFADDDMVFVDGYEQIIIKTFEACPDADAIKFYCESTNPQRPLSYKKPVEVCKATQKKLMSAGVPGFAIKRDFLLKNPVFFNPVIGSGQKIYCGEDSVFYSNLLKHNANIYLSPILLSYVNQGESSWFKGYDEQFCVSIGYIYSAIYGALAPLAAFRRALRESKNQRCNLSFKQLFFTMLKGIKKHRKRGN